MSYSYSRIIPEPISFKQYGFHSVSSQEMYSIVRRLQAPTYNTELYHGECFKQQPCPPRNPSTYCRRAKSANTEKGRHRPEPTFTSERDLDRVFRRVRTPTLSKMAAEGKIAPSYETNFDQFRTGSQKEYTPLEQKKMTRRLLRPTTAVRNKALFSFSEDPALSKYHQYDFSADDDVAEADIIEDIVDRVRAPTIASEGGIGPTCPKRRDSIGKRSTMKDMPLVCGLARSKNIDEIVNRLYTPTEAIPICRPSSARGAKGKENDASRNGRPKSASSAITPNLLRSLSSYSTSSLSSRSSSASTNRSKFSNVSDYDRTSNKKAIYISRKPPTGKKDDKKEHKNSSDNERKMKTKENNDRDDEAKNTEIKIESTNANRNTNSDSKDVKMQSDEESDTKDTHDLEGSENEQNRPGSSMSNLNQNEEHLPPTSKGGKVITHQVKVTLPLYTSETDTESEENNDKKSPKVKVESSHYETTTDEEGTSTLRNLTTTDDDSTSNLSTTDNADKKNDSSVGQQKNLSDDMDVVPPSLSGSSGRSSPSTQSMNSTGSTKNK